MQKESSELGSEARALVVISDKWIGQLTLLNSGARTAKFLTSWLRYGVEISAREWDGSSISATDAELGDCCIAQFQHIKAKTLIWRGSLNRVIWRWHRIFNATIFLRRFYSSRNLQQPRNLLLASTTWQIQPISGSRKSSLVCTFESGDDRSGLFCKPHRRILNYDSCEETSTSGSPSHTRSTISHPPKNLRNSPSNASLSLRSCPREVPPQGNNASSK